MDREYKYPIADNFMRRNVCALVVDDVELNRMVARTMLESLGFSTSEARDGHEAVSHVRDRMFDFVLMDVHMPDMGGLEATRMIKDIRCDQVVFAWSDCAALDLIRKDGDPGFHTILDKPLVRDALESAIRSLRAE